MKEKINNIELSSIMFLLLFSSCLGIIPYVTIQLVDIDAYISSIIGGIIGLIPLFIMIYIFNYEVDSPIYIKTKLIFGKIIGTVINIILIIVYLVIIVTMLFNVSNFIISQYLTNTPLFLVTLTLGMTALHTVNKGMYTISKISFIYVVITLIFYIVGFIGIFPETEIGNIKPILEFGITKPFCTGLIYTLLFTSPMYSILVIPKNSIENNDKTNKYLIITYLLIAIMIFIVIIVTSTSLGKYLVRLYQYPPYIALKKISIFGFIDRIENFLSIQWILSAFIGLTIPIYYVKSSIKEKNNKLITLIIVIIAICTSTWLFKSNTNFNNYLKSTYPYILIIPLIIYFIIFIIIFIKKRYKKIK